MLLTSKAIESRFQKKASGSEYIGSNASMESFDILFSVCLNELSVCEVVAMSCSIIFTNFVKILWSVTL